MRRILFILLAICALCRLDAQTAKHPEFCATIDNMQPMKYPSRNVTGGFSMTVQSDSADVYLPYMGEVYIVPFSDDGIHFNEPIKEVRIKRTKKDDATEMSFTMRHDIVDYNFLVTLYDNNNFYLFMQPSNGDSCSYTGDWEKLQSE